ncbi:hypothetical protein TTHERM_00080010 (macronuclear) [Tetrahymena thermophila SB210]|uniref:Uncharacterized protein n=1 Tax=Tetrahymena thermophila (strain SB210) TaxID=312017 RepID=Q23FL4_TETTS|nr:hypothetical protein TTHERM_00080010 [Tetrahymena thermophila SB210]EAR95596.2 hypothetical protein TTHERM_00080010 [Tetrahymena thermophila SB210]|eukprot:XP_001015841.2 hypothetical protein TTHERM_00080010 [Tetrahymena thermophila SB210]
MLTADKNREKQIISRESFIEYRLQEKLRQKQFQNQENYFNRYELEGPPFQEEEDDGPPRLEFDNDANRLGYDDDAPPGLETDQSPKKNQMPQKNSQFNDQDFNSEFPDRYYDQKNSNKKDQKGYENNSLDISSGQKQNNQESEQEMLNKVFLEFCDDPQTYYDYPSAQNFMDLIITKEKNQEDKRSKKEEDKKLLEEYLNRLFVEKNGDTYKETLENEREASDEETIKKQIDKFKEEQANLSVSIKRVDTERWNVESLKKELRSQYKKQGEQYKKIIDLFHDKLGLKGIIKEKDKKIIEIQRVLEELNHKKVIYLDLKNEKKEDLTFNFVKKTRDEEISKLKENEIRLNKEVILYKTKYETYQSKYKEIMQEAQNAKKEIQELISQVLEEKKQAIRREEEESKRQIAEKENKNKVKQGQNKYSLNNTMITSQIISPMQQNVEEMQNGFDKSSFPFYHDNGRYSGTNQLIQSFSANKKSSAPNTPPQKGPLSPNISLKSNQTQNDQQHNNNQNVNQLSQNNQEQNTKQRLQSFDLNNEEQSSFQNQNQQQQQQQSQQQQNQQIQQYQQQSQQQHQQQNLPDKQQTQQQSTLDYQKQTYSNLNSSLQDHKISNNSQFENKKQKVNFQIKTKEEEEEYYYKQLCASKIKFMVESIQNSNILQKSVYNKKR